MHISFQLFIPTIVAFSFFFTIYFLDKKFSFEPWVIRKLIHSLGMLIIGVFVLVFGNSLVEIAIAIGIFFIFFLIFLLPPFKLIEYIFLRAKRPEEKLIEAIINVGLTSSSILLLFLFFQNSLLFFLSGLFVLAIGDAFGEFFGRIYGKHRYVSLAARLFKMNRFKSVEGSVGVFVGSFIALLLSIIAYNDLLLLVQDLGLSLIIILFFISLIATLLESISISFLDNILLPWGAALAFYYLYRLMLF